MKFTIHKIGNTRQIFAFLYLPKSINGETRWWESACWEEEYQNIHNYDWHDQQFWVATRWLS